MSLKIPAQTKGKAVDLEHTVTADTIAEADHLFNMACDRVLHPQKWATLTNGFGASFTPVDRSKKMINRSVRLHDFIEIDIPAPGKDWVRVSAIERDSDSVALTLLVSPEPGKETEGVGHFFDEGATSTFIIRRKEKSVTASYHGRNETPHTDKIRNTIVALGALAGLSEIQWSSLLEGFLQKDKTEE